MAKRSRKSTSPVDLDWLFAPLSAAAFFSHHFGRAPLHLKRRRPGYYDPLLAIADLDSILVAARGGMADLRIAREGEDETHARYERVQEQTEDRAFMGALYEAYHAGATLNLQFLDRRWPKIGALCRALRAEIEHPLDAGLYLTPGRAQGLPAHSDHEDVIVLQVHGEKTWQLFGELGPRRLERFVAPDLEREGPTRVVEMRPGDLLYLPGGIVHQAMTTGDAPSLHVTIAVRMVRWIDLFVDALHEWAEDDARLREALPVGYLTRATTQRSVQTRFRRLARELFDDLDPTPGIDRQAHRFAHKTDPIPDGYFGRALSLDAIDDGSILERRDPYCRVQVSGDYAALQTTGGSIEGPAWLAPAFRLLARTPQTPVHALPIPGGAADRIAFARTLVERGVMRVVSPSARPGAR